MFGSIGPEFQCLKGSDQNSNVAKDQAQNSSVSKDKVRIPMFRRIGPEF